mgnify:FL=1
MQNNENRKNGPVRTFLREKGYYIVLFLCLAAVGISGYVFVSGAIAEKNALQEPALSVQTQATVPQTAQKPAQQSADTTPREAAQETAAMSRDDEVRAQAAAVRVWPVSGTQTQAYSMEALSWNETTHDWRTHDGMDLAALAGEPVMAASAGTVSAVYDDEYFGTTVTIVHDGGYTTRYQNLAAMPTVTVGQRVSAGQTIGAVGASAMLEIAQEPHLHFAVTRNGVSVDPMEFLD